MQPAISIENLHVRYRIKKQWVHAVRGLSLQVQPGEIVGFLGPNGAGKSSTLKALLGLIQPTEGTCQIFGEPAGTPSANRRLGYLPEVAMYYPHLTPKETLQLYGGLQGIEKKLLNPQIDDLIERLGLGTVCNKLNRTLSKGQLQRVGIAQALLGYPELLILDEVTSGIDPVGRHELRSILREQADAGTTIFFSSHELAEVDMLCDRILLLNQGQLIDEHQVSDLRQRLGRYRVTFRSPVGSQEVTFTSKQAMVEALASGEWGEPIDLIAHDGDLETYFVETLTQSKEAA